MLNNMYNIQKNTMQNIKLNNILNIQLNIQLNNMLHIQLNNMLNIHFYFKDTATTKIYTLSLHDALPIFGAYDLDEETREVMLDVLSRDARLSLSYAGEDLAAVDCPLEAWGAEQDAIVSAEHLSGWRDYAVQTFRTRMFAGGHYFCLDDPEPALALLGPMTAPAGATRGKVR